MVLDNKITKKIHKAVELKLAGKNVEAINVFERILEARPYLPTVLKPLSELYVATMQYHKAAEMYERMIAVEDEEDLDGYFYVNYANALKFSGKYAAAEANYLRSLELLPNTPSVLIEYAQYQFDLELFEEAVELYDQALSIDKNSLIALIGKSIIFSQTNKFDEAEAVIRKALALYPNNPYALEGLVRITLAAKKYVEAEDILMKAINLYPDMVLLRLDQGLMYLRTYRLELALQSYNDVLKLNPNVKMAQISKAYVLTQLMQFEAALAEYDKLLQQGVDYDVMYKKSFTELQMGRFSSGWENHEARLQLEKYIFYTPLVKKMGITWHRNTPSVDSNVLVYSEQGLGDVIQMSRYIKKLIDNGLNVTFHVDKSLYPLFKTMPEIANTVVDERPVNYTQYTSVMSLPFEFQTDAETIPLPLSIDLPAQEITKWQNILGIKKSKRIGIVNSGNPKHINDYNRSILLKDLLQALPLENEYYLLHKDIREVDLQFLNTSECQHTVYIMKDHLTSFVDTACLCSMMDKVIGVDTSVIHLAGTLGKPTLLLLPYVPDWRWLLQTETTSWYPSITLLRQDEYGSWQSVWKKLPQYLS